MAHKKAGGSTQLGRDSQPKYLGVKVSNGKVVNAGVVLVRQRGTAIHPGKNVRVGRQDTLYAVISGKVQFTQKKRVRFDQTMRMTTFVNIIPVSGK